MQQHAGREEADDRAAGCDADPRSDCFAPLLGREHGGDDRKRDGHDQRRRDAHSRPERDQRARGVDEQGRERDGTEEREPDRQERLPSEPVADRARGQKQGREHDRVSVDDPLKLRLGRAGVAGDARQRDVQAGDRGDDHHQGQAHDSQHRSAPLFFTCEFDRTSHDLPPLAKLIIC